MSRFVFIIIGVLSVAMLQSCAESAVACKGKSDCTDATKPFCNETLGSCVECFEDAQCNPGHFCSQGSCQAGCPSKQAGCSLGLYCKPGSECVQCLDDTNCPAGKICQKNACVPGCSKHNECPDGLVCDLAASSCVECLTDANCGGKAPTCNPSTHTCVECGKNSDCQDPSKPVCDTASHACVGCTTNPDSCPPGNYCRPDQVCERGCKDSSDCPDNVECNPTTHSCNSCTSDTHCAAGNVCDSTGTCVPACSATNPCGNGRDCCDGRCVDGQTDSNNCGACGKTCGSSGTCCAGACKTFDTVDNCGACGKACGSGAGCCNEQCVGLNTPQNCGACGRVCGADQFCDGTTCRNAVFPEFCVNLHVYAIHDDAPSGFDNTATDLLASTIQQYCSQQTIVEVGSQTNASWVDQSTGALLLGGGSTVVTAGGPFPNKPTKWLETTKQVTKVYFETNRVDTYYFKHRDGSTVTSRLASWCNASRDVFVVELAADPSSSTLALLAYGLCKSGNGTRSAAWYWANEMLPHRASYPDSWYVYEWVDANGNGSPDASDTFTKLGSGR